MTKIQLIEKLKNELSSLPADELENRLAFYSEMIDDRIEEGLSEEAAIAEIGDIDEIIAQLKADCTTVTEEQLEDALDQEVHSQEHSLPEKRKMRAWEIVLLSLGSPLWIVLLAAAFIILLSVYIVIWAVAGSLWAVPVSFAGVTVGGIAVGVVSMASGNALIGITLLGAAIACAGLAIFAGFGCFHLTRLAVYLSKVIAKGVISLFRRKEKKNA